MNEPAASLDDLLAEALDDLPEAIGRKYEQLQEALVAQLPYIVRVFPEYTPHDDRLHGRHLFRLADELFEDPVLRNLNQVEIVLLAFGLLGHDWGMAISEAQEEEIRGGADPESANWLAFLGTQPKDSDEAWKTYVRRTHHTRSQRRLEEFLREIGEGFGYVVGQLARAHGIDISEIRDVEVFRRRNPVLGSDVNMAALATYVRLADLLDLGADRTPFALWKFVAPLNPISEREWKKHRAIAQVTCSDRVPLVSGRTDDHEVFAALSDLRRYVEEQYTDCISVLRTLEPRYRPSLDSRIEWQIAADGFEPIIASFDLDRTTILRHLSATVYGRDRYAFIRELLQNSVDALDSRMSLLAQQGIRLLFDAGPGITIELEEQHDGVAIAWSDDGIGMDENVVRSFFAQVGSSFYASGEAARRGLDTEPISRFGIGILSCFAVSERMTVETRPDRSFSSDGGLSVVIPSLYSTFRIAKETTRHTPGTTIHLFFPQGVSESPAGIAERIENRVSELAGFVSYPIELRRAGRSTILRPIGEEKGPASSRFARTPELSMIPLTKKAEAALEHVTVHTLDVLAKEAMP